MIIQDSNRDITLENGSRVPNFGHPPFMTHSKYHASKAATTGKKLRGNNEASLRNHSSFDLKNMLRSEGLASLSANGKAHLRP
jgi:hypothetical protein